MFCGSCCGARGGKDAPLLGDAPTKEDSSDDGGEIVNHKVFRPALTPRAPRYTGDDEENDANNATSAPTAEEIHAHAPAERRDSTRSLTRGFSFPERLPSALMEQSPAPRPALVRRSSFTTEGKKEPNPAFAGKTVRFALPQHATAGDSDSDSSDGEGEQQSTQASLPVSTASTTSASQPSAPLEPEGVELPAAETKAPAAEQKVSTEAERATSTSVYEEKQNSRTPYNTASFSQSLHSASDMAATTASSNATAAPAPASAPAPVPAPVPTPAPVTAAPATATTATAEKPREEEKTPESVPPPASPSPASGKSPTANGSPAKKDNPKPKPVALPAKDAVRPNPWRFASSGKLSDKYEITEQVLGSGAFGVVKVGRVKTPSNKSTNQLVAVKIIPKTSKLLTAEEFLEEVDIISRLQHTHIITLLDKYETEQNVYLVMELAEGGELFDRLVEEKKIEEREARQIAFQLFDAIAYLHSQGICHRDLKPENILFMEPYRFSPIKITDFGFAKHLMNKEQLLHAVAKRGTMGYAAPEIFSNQPYDEKCDVWSAGVIVYIMLCGAPPFVPLPAPEEAFQKPFWRLADPKKKTPLPGETVQFPDRYWSGISRNAQHFIECALQVDPLKRARAIDLLKHPWIKAHTKQSAMMTFQATEPLPFFNPKNSMR